MVSVFAPLTIVLRSSEMPILEIIDLLIAYVLIWSALDSRLACTCVHVRAD